MWQDRGHIEGMESRGEDSVEPGDQMSRPFNAHLVKRYSHPSSTTRPGNIRDVGCQRVGQGAAERGFNPEGLESVNIVGSRSGKKFGAGPNPGIQFKVGAAGHCGPDIPNDPGSDLEQLRRLLETPNEVPVLSVDNPTHSIYITKVAEMSPDSLIDSVAPEAPNLEGSFAVDNITNAGGKASRGYPDCPSVRQAIERIIQSCTPATDSIKSPSPIVSELKDKFGAVGREGSQKKGLFWNCGGWHCRFELGKIRRFGASGIVGFFG